MLWNKTDLDGLKKEVTLFPDTFLTAHTNTTNINSLWNDFKSGCLDIMNPLGKFDEVEEFFVVWSGFIFTEHGVNVVAICLSAFALDNLF
jgi:pyridoxal/pyridoxine/pyridoxamine kinase